jgi:hypothetical protein
VFLESQRLAMASSESVALPVTATDETTGHQ